MAHPVIGNSLFAIVLALMHVPPMFALLWAQRRLRLRLVETAETPVSSRERAPDTLPEPVPMLVSPSSS
jgi:hypothetical protein